MRLLSHSAFLAISLSLVVAGHAPSHSAHTNMSTQTQLDVHAYPVPPPELALELVQVHVYVRHGERTPVRVRLNAAPASVPAHWMMCHARPALAFPAEPSESSSAYSTVVERVDGSPAPGQCLLGELTDLGRESTHNYGRALRKLYVDRLAFLPPTLPAAPDALLYLRSTNVPRTIESLAHLARGLYPPSADRADARPAVRTRNPADETLAPNPGACARLRTLLERFAQAAATRHNPALAALDAQLVPCLGAPVRVDGRPRASGILDTIRAARAHGVPLPRALAAPGVEDAVERAVVDEWFAGYKDDEVRRLGMGPLLGELARKMRRKAAASASVGGAGACAGGPQMLVHATHDAALAALLATLDVFDDRWPEFTASVTFELFRPRAPAPAPGGHPDAQRALPAPSAPDAKSAPAGDHYVRVRYQNRSLRLPLCAGAGAHAPGHPELCALARFEARAAELALGRAAWEAACAA